MSSHKKLYNFVDSGYINLFHEILEYGEEKQITREDGRTINTLSLFNSTLEFDLRHGFPILTTKKVNHYAPFDEILWMLSGSTNVNDLPKRSQFIWSKWADKDGNLGNIYGKQMRMWETLQDDETLGEYNGTNFSEDMLNKHSDKKYIRMKTHMEKYGCEVFMETIDQIEKIRWQLKNTPNSRRIVLNLWKVDEIDSMNLPPCHMLTVFYVSGNGKVLNTHVTMRSSDVPVGLPFNMCQYGLLTHILAKDAGLEAGKLAFTLVDAHIYENQKEGVCKQIKNYYDGVKEKIVNPNGDSCYPLPTLKFDKKDNIYDYKTEDFILENYRCMPFIKFPVFV